MEQDEEVECPECGHKTTVSRLEEDTRQLKCPRCYNVLRDHKGEWYLELED